MPVGPKRTSIVRKGGVTEQRVGEHEWTSPDQGPPAGYEQTRWGTVTGQARRQSLPSRHADELDLPTWPPVLMPAVGNRTISSRERRMEQGSNYPKHSQRLIGYDHGVEDAYMTSAPMTGGGRIIADVSGPAGPMRRGKR